MKTIQHKISIPTGDSELTKNITNISARIHESLSKRLAASILIDSSDDVLITKTRLSGVEELDEITAVTCIISLKDVREANNIIDFCINITTDEELKPNLLRCKSLLTETYLTGGMDYDAF